MHAPLFHDAWDVFGMQWAHRLFNILLQNKSAIVHPALIEEIDDAVRPKTPGHNGNRVDDKPNAIFASTQFLFGTITLDNLPSQFFIRRRKLSGSFVYPLFQLLVKSLDLLLGLDQLRSLEDVPIPIALRYHKPV